MPGAEDTSLRVSAVIFIPKGLDEQTRGRVGGQLAGSLGSQTFVPSLSFTTVPYSPVS